MSAHHDRQISIGRKLRGVSCKPWGRFEADGRASMLSLLGVITNADASRGANKALARNSRRNKDRDHNRPEARCRQAADRNRAAADSLAAAAHLA